MTRGRVLIVKAQIYCSEGDELLWTVEQRIPWPDDQTVEEVAESAIKEVCRGLHAPKYVVTRA